MILVSVFAALGGVSIRAAAWRLRGLTGAEVAFMPAHGCGRAGQSGPFQLTPGVGGSRYSERRRRPTVSVVVPALNEEECVGWVIDNLPDWVSEVVLVDGLSVDGTELVVTDRREDVVIVHQRARGKGAALRAGFAAASGDIVVMIDADGSTDPREMSRFVDALIDGAQFVKGSRNLDGGGSVDSTRLRHLGNLGFVWSANVLFGVRFTDLCYGYCAFWRHDLDGLALTADGFEIEMELVLSAVRGGMTIAEVPSLELARRAGTSNLHAWKDGKRVLKTLLKERLRQVDPEQVAAARIRLARVQLAAHGTRGWVPAGTDRRGHLDRDRRVGPHIRRARYAGSERRDHDRRSLPARTTGVLIAHPAPTWPSAHAHQAHAAALAASKRRMSQAGGRSQSSSPAIRPSRTKSTAAS